jgi:sigma-B regulation protein RsbU (phosphoserine phosphatase)
MEQLPIAMFPATNYQSSGIDLLPWDLLVVVSDGFLEVTNSRGEEFGLERLEEFIVQNANEPLLRIIDRLREETDRFGSHDDDQTILLLRSVEIGCG